MKRHAIIFWVAMVLAVIGIVDMAFFDKGALIRLLLIPLLVIGVIFLLYKYQPRRAKKQKIKIKPSAKTMEKVAAAKRTNQTSGKRKHYPFQVIEGSKGKNDDQQPKYH
ncbi:hypothetical protein P9847_09575 [Paenibacillus chibensis]|uniref:Uncharacterized protein n=1 Tax=Paenibacillus chibensis TaxID=59846 RepID=A0ABU6PRP1_9BACL|nr:hypothetical protein [Paenibacillus chibensis]